MPQVMRVQGFKDMTGGLNLRADQFQLAANESPALLNVDVDPRGGVRLRRGVSPFEAGATPNTAAIHSVGQFHAGAYDHVIIGAGTAVYQSSGPSWSVVGLANTVSTPHTYAQFKNNLYIQNGTDAPLKWTGAVASRLAQAYNDDIATPTSGNMPIGKIACTHNGHVFVANTLEAGTQFPHRIRFSHPNQPESFRSFDWFDVDPGVDGDQIVAMVSFNDHLVVFKGKSMYAVFGFDAESFQVQNITREIGAVANRAVVATPQGVYFFGWPTGLMLYDGKGLSWKFSKLIPSIDEGHVLETRLTEVTLGWVNSRIWVGIPWGSSSSKTYVYDPSLGRDGAWVEYDLTLGPIINFAPEAQSRYPLAALRASIRLVRLEVVDQTWDQIAEAGDHVHITSYYRTPWFDNGEPAQRKRWKRPTMVFKGDTNSTLTVQAFWDYDESEPRRSFTSRVGPSSPNFQYDDAGISVYDLDGVVWGKSVGTHVVERGSSLGNARAVQLLFTGPVDADVAWGLDSVSLLYIPKRIR